ncbi:MAG: LysR family transcriptional regulator [Prolixibacteraceae bacterium]
MDYRDEVFLAVAEGLSFSRAAEELYISQPAVTKHIKELERRLNIGLFERKGNKIYLTEAGKLTYDFLIRIRHHYGELEFQLGRLSDAFIGSIRIGCSSTISQYCIPKVLAAFYKRYPNIKLFVFNGNSFEMESKLLTNEIDLALVENESSRSEIHYRKFLEDEIVLVTAAQSEYAKRRTLSVDDLRQVPIVLREKGSGTLEVIQKSFARHSISVESLNIFIHLGSNESIKNFLCDFQGVALISERAIEKELLYKTLVRLNLLHLSFPREFRIALRHGHDTSGTTLFIDFLLNYNF